MWDAVPNSAKIFEIIVNYEGVKRNYTKCMNKQCYTDRVYNNNRSLRIYEDCAHVDPFHYWTKLTSEVKAKPIVALLMEHFDVPLYQIPTEGSTKAINSLYQAKYSFFTCNDASRYIGGIDIDPSLITYWDRD